MSGEGANRRAGRPRGARLDGERVRRRRQELQLSRAALAELTGLSLKTIQKAERGESLSRDSVRRLCEMLGIPAHSLVRLPAAEVSRRLRARGRVAPPPPAHWVGRPEVDELASRLRRRSSVCWCICGPSGVGKTALAQHLAATLAEGFPEGLLWVTCSGPRGETRADLAQLDLAYALGFEHALPPLAAVGRQAFDAAFRDELWQRDCLLILDDLASREFFEHFAVGLEGVRVLATSRFRHLADGFLPSVLTLGALPLDRARQLLARRVGLERLARDPEGTARLLRRLGGSPGSILRAARVLSRERLTRPGALAERLAPQSTAGSAPADGKPAGVATDPLWGAATRPVCTISPAAHTLFRRLGVLGDAPFTPFWAAAAGGLNRDEAQRLLSELADVFLVQPLSGPGDPEGALRLDGHAVWLAEAASERERGEVLARLVEAALRRARSLRTEPLSLGMARESPLWRLCLDHLVSQLPVDPPEALLRDPWGAAPVAAVSDTLGRTLLDLVTALEPLLVRERLPESARWLAAAVTAAANGPTGRVPARLVLTVAVWQLFGDGDLGEVARLAGDLPERLMADGEPLAAVGSCLLQADLAAGFGDLAAQERAHRAALAIARDTGLSGVQLAFVLNRLAATLLQRPGPETALDEADSAWGEAIEACASTRTGGAFVAAVCRANRALLALWRGVEEARRELEVGLRGVLAGLPERFGLDRAQIMAQAAHTGLCLDARSPEDLAAEAGRNWRRALLESTSEVARRQAATLAAGAFYRGLALDRPEASHRSFARGLCGHTLPTDAVSAEHAIPGVAGLELILVGSLAATDRFYRGDLLQLGLRFVEEAAGRRSRAWLAEAGLAAFRRQGPRAI